MGGPSIVWNRLAVKNETKIRPHDYPDAKAVKTNTDDSSLATFIDGGRRSVLDWKEAVLKAKLRWAG